MEMQAATSTPAAPALSPVSLMRMQAAGTARPDAAVFPLVPTAMQYRITVFPSCSNKQEIRFGSKFRETTIL